MIDHTIGRGTIIDINLQDIDFFTDESPSQLCEGMMVNFQISETTHGLIATDIEPMQQSC